MKSNTENKYAALFEPMNIGKLPCTTRIPSSFT